MKTYFVVFAQDVPHYGQVEIAATGDDDALAKARVHWARVQSEEEPWPLTDPEYGSGVLDRIVEITDEGGRQAHLNGPIAKALMAKAAELFSKPPEIERAEVLGVKLPR